MFLGSIEPEAPTNPPSNLIDEEEEEVAPSGQDLKVFISGINYRIRNDFIRKVIARIGSLAAWERFEDPLTKRYMNFGFAHFLTRDMAVTASRVLNGLKFSTECLIAPIYEEEKKVTSLDIVLEAKNDNRVGAFNFISESDEKRVLQLRKKILDIIPKINEETLKIPYRDKYEALYHTPDIIEKDVTEEDIDENLTLEPRMFDITDDVYEDLVEFRRYQVKEEIIAQRRRKRLVRSYVKRARRDRERTLEAKSNLSVESKKTEKKSKKRRGFSSAPRDLNKGRDVLESEFKPADLSNVDVNISFENTTSKGKSKKVFENEFTSNEAYQNKLKKERKLKPIEYSKEELNAVKSREEKLIDAIKQATEKYLGESDDSFEKFVLAKIRKGTSEKRLQKDVEDILDDESADFVLLLKPYF